MHTEKLRGLALDTAVGFLQTARDPVHTTTHIFRMLRHIEGCQLTKKAFLELAEQAEYREIIQQRFDPIWPSAEELRSMPPSSLGACMQKRFDVGNRNVRVANSRRYRPLPPGYFLRRRRAYAPVQDFDTGSPRRIRTRTSREKRRCPRCSLRE